MEGGRLKGRARLLITLALAVVILAPLLPGVLYVLGATGGVEFALVDVWMPMGMYGQLGVYAFPFNVSDPSMLSFSNLYVVDQQGNPYYSYLFSNSPPFAVWVDGAVATKTYSIFYGGANPYPDYIATPGGPVPLFAAYDDFDYETGLWNISGTYSLSQSQLQLSGRALLNTSYTPGVLSLWLVRFGERGSAIQLYTETGFTGWLYLRLDASNFGDWDSIVDGNDIYFTDQYGNPLNYTVARLDKTVPVADILIYASLPAGSTTIYMHYGGTNPYPEYRTAPTTTIQATDITPRPKTIAPQSIEKITGYQTTSLTLVSLNLTNITIQPGDSILPHLYDFDFQRDSVVYRGISATAFSSAWSFVAEWKISEIQGVNPLSIAGYRPVFLYHYGGGELSTGFVSKETGTYYELKYKFDGAAQADTWYFGGSYYTAQGVLGVFNENAYYEVTHSYTTQNNYRAVNIGYGGGWYMEGTIAYAIAWNQKLPLSDLQAIKSTKIVPSTGLTFFADATFWNGTHYIDIASGTVGSSRYGNTFRVEAENKWLWLIRSLRSDNLVHLEWFPVDSIVKIYDASGKLTGIVHIRGLASGGGMVPDVAVPLSAGNYTIVVDTYVAAKISGEKWRSSVWTGLTRHVGTDLEGYTTSESIMTANGGTLYVEYSDATGYGVAWYQPSPYTSRATDYTTQETGWTPFPQYNDYTSTSNLKEIHAPLNNITITQNITIQGGELVVPHLYEWSLDGQTGYIYLSGLDLVWSELSVYTRFLVNVPKGLAGGTDFAYIIFENYNASGINPYFRIAVSNGDGVGYYHRTDNNVEESFVVNTYNVSDGVFHELFIQRDASGVVYMYLDGNPIGSSSMDNGTYSLTNPSKKLTVSSSWGKLLFPGKISFVILYNITTQHPSNTVNASGLTLFLEPTAFNGTHYLDLTGGVTGIPYGGVSRVEAEQKWLWVVQGLYSDSVVHLAWFPQDTFVVFKNATTGEVVASVIVPAGQEGTVVSLPPGNYTVTAKLLPPTSYRRITQTLTINPNDAIAPHLYDWRFDGRSGYIYIGFNWSVLNSGWSFMFTLRADDIEFNYFLGATAPALPDGTVPYFYFRYAGSFRQYFQHIQRSTDTGELIGVGSGAGIPPGWHFVAYTWNTTYFTTYVDGSLNTASDDRSGKGQDYSSYMYLGKHAGFFSGDISYMAVWSRVLTINELDEARWSKKIDATNLVLFLDATFWNGTHYVDLSSYGYSGTPYGGVTRILANETWLWLVQGLYSDNKVHFRFVPVGTVIRLYDSYGILKYVFYVDGPGNGAGLVEDYVVSIAAGTYTVEMLVPDWGTSKASVSVSSVSYTGSRDGYSLQMTASFDLPQNGTLAAAAVGVVDTPLYMFDSNSKAYPAVYAWGLSPVVDTGFNTSLATVFEARLHSDAGWYVGVLDAYGDLWTLAGVYGLGGEVYLYDGFSDVVVDTGLNYTVSDWVYVYLKLEPDGTVVVGVGNGTYAPGGIYESVQTYTYQPPVWSPTYVAFMVGIASRDSGTYTLYVDWSRVRVEVVSGFTLESGYTLEPVEEYRYLPGTGDGNWTLYLDASGLEGFSLTLPATNDSYVVEFGDWQDAFATDAYVAGKASPAIRILDSSGQVLAQTQLQPPASGTLVVGYNGSYLYVGLDESNSYTEIVAAPVQDSFLGVAWLWYVGTLSPLFLHNGTALLGTFVSSAPAVVPSPGTGSYFKLGYEYRPGNVTYVEWGVEINGSSLGLYADINGSVSRFPLGIAATPMVLGVGFSFDNSTGRLTVYALSSWLESAGGSPVTRWISGYLEVPSSIEVAWGTPFADSQGGVLLVDRFGLTLGAAMEQVVRGSVKAVASGPYPVGGLVKYVSINQPIKIRLVGGNIVVEPSSGPGTITLEGFQGWTLDLALYGTSTSNIMISSDPYTLDFPIGFTAVIVADISSRKLSLVSANAPPQIGGGAIPQGQTLAPIIVAAPRFTHVFDPPTVINQVLLAATLVAAAIASSRLTGSPADGVIIAGFVAAVVLLILGDYINMTIAILVMVAAMAARTALQS